MKSFLIFTWALLSAFLIQAAPTSNPAFADFNPNQFSTTGRKVSLLNGAFVTNLTFNSFTICDPGTTNCTTYNWPLTNGLSGQFLTTVTNGTNSYLMWTNLPTSTVVFDTIEELVATPIPLPGIGLLAYVRDPLRGGPLAFYPNSVDATNRFDTFASLDGPGNWKRPPDPNVYPQHGVVTGGAVTNDTLVAALVLQSARAVGKVIYSGSDEFLYTDDVPLLDNNILYFEDGAQATGLVLSANSKTNIVVYGAHMTAAVASPSTGAFYLTNSFTLIQSPSFVGYSLVDPIIRSGTVRSIQTITMGTNGMVISLDDGGSVIDSGSPHTVYPLTIANPNYMDSLLIGPEAQVGLRFRSLDLTGLTNFYPVIFDANGPSPENSSLTLRFGDSPSVFAIRFSGSGSTFTGFIKSETNYYIGGKAGAPYATWTGGNGSPEGVIAATVGSFFSRFNGGAATSLYVKETGAAGNTGWVAVGAGGGAGATNAYNLVQEEGAGLTARTTINFIGAGVTAVDNGGATRTDVTISGGTTVNPTDGYLPYRTGATTFGDSPWYRITTNKLGFNGVVRFLHSTTTGNNLSLGLGAGDLLPADPVGGYNVLIGGQAGSIISSGSENTIVGASAGTATDGSQNVIVGFSAGSSLGDFNVAIGHTALLSATGNDNVAVGNGSLSGGESTRSVGIGRSTLILASSSSENTAVGYVSGASYLDGKNTFLGSGSGYKEVSGTNFWISGTNTIAIGYGASGKGVNTAQIGNSNVWTIYLGDSVGWFRGSGSPEGVITAPIGSYFTREDGGASTTFYVKESGTGNTGWVAFGAGGGGGGSETAGTVHSGGDLTLDNAIVRGDGTGGTNVQKSVVKISDAGAITEALSVAVTNGVAIGDGTNLVQIRTNAATTFPIHDRSGSTSLRALEILTGANQDVNFIASPDDGGGMVTFRGFQGLGFIPKPNGPDFGTDIGGFQYRTPVESMSNNFFIFRGGQYLFESQTAGWMVSMTPSGMNVGSPADNASIPLSMLEVWGGMAIGKSYARTNAAPTDGLIVQGRVGFGLSNPAFPLEVASTDSQSFAYQRTGVSAKKWGFASDNSFTYWQNITDGINPLSLSNAGNLAALGNVASGAAVTAATSVSAATGVFTNTLTLGGNTVATSANNLSFFAAATSAQLSGMLSDETGSGSGGLAMFSLNPSVTGGATVGGGVKFLEPSDNGTSGITVKAPNSNITSDKTQTLQDATGTILLDLNIDDTAFASSWNGVTTIAATKNAVYDWGHIFDTDDDGKVNVLDLGAGIPSTDSSGVLALAKADVLDAPNFAADAGASDTYAATLSPAITGYVTGTHYRFKANTANTGAATINFNSVGAATIVKVAGGITTTLANNDIRVGQWVDLVYDGTNMQMQSTLGNAPTASITGTDTQVLFFDGANNPAGDAGMTYSKTTDMLTVNGSYYTASTGSCLMSGNGSFAASAEIWLKTDAAKFYFGALANSSLEWEGAGNLQLGTDAAAPVNQILSGPDGVGTDKVGGDFVIAGGQSTGTGTPGRVGVKSSSVGATGSSANAYTTTVKVGGTLKVDTTTTGNVGAGEDTLITYTTPAGQLAVNGDYYEFDVWGSCAANANTKQIKVVYGGTTLIDGGAVVLNGVSWRAHGKVVRLTATTQTATCELTVGGTLLSAVNGTISLTTAPTETLSGTVVFRVTGTSAIAPADNDIVQNGMVIKWMPNN